MKHIMLCICVCSPSCGFSASLTKILTNLEQKIFINHQKANAIQLFVSIKREFPKGYLINIATCLIAYHSNGHQVVDKNLPTLSKS